MKEKYKNKEWLNKQLQDEKRTMASISHKFNKDITTIRYWRDKFGIKVKKDVKYPIKEYICPVCGKVFQKRVTKKSQAVYCSQDCAYKGRGLGYTERNIKGGYDTSPTEVEITCDCCGKEFIVERAKKNRKYCSRECFYKAHKENMNGANNPSWDGGNSYNKRSYRGENWNEQRTKCYKRDNYRCCVCGVKCIGRGKINKNNGKKLIQCHHIKKFKDITDNKLDNLITVCASCHKKIHEGVIKYEMVKD